MKKLTLSEWTSIAEIIGMIAVIISLIFVGYEIRQNTGQMEADGLSRGLGSMNAVAKLTATPEDTEYILRAFEDFEAMNQTERALFEGKIQPIIMEFEVAIKQNDKGFLTDEELAGFEKVVSSILRSPGTRQYYEYAKEFTPPYLETRLNQAIAKYEGERTFLDYLRFGTEEKSKEDR